MKRVAVPGSAARPVRVLVVDDSQLARELLTDILSADTGIEVVGTAADPLIAREMIKELQPDVLTLDIRMPRMDGLTFLGNLMRLRPMPVVMVSSLTHEGAAVTLDALALGAVDFVPKPGADAAWGLAGYALELQQKVRAAALAQVSRLDDFDATGESAALPRYQSADRLIAIGASTGGTEAIRQVITAMPADAPAIVVALHIPAAFSGPFAERLNRHSRMTVCEAQEGLPVVPGRVYVAPGDAHLRVQRSGARWLCRLGDDAEISGHRPSVDALFLSVAAHAGARASAALLTGMGEDGARGLCALNEAGAVTLVQDEPTSVVWGMPGAAIARGATREMVPLQQIAHRLLASTHRIVA